MPGTAIMNEDNPAAADGNLTDEVMALFVPVEGKRWSLVQTRPRNEKYAERSISNQGITAYLPLITKVEIHNRSRRERQLPMFPGYLFACPAPEEETLQEARCRPAMRAISTA